MKVRLAEVAARAGVSLSTVSRVLNDKPGVNEGTRESVMVALDVLGYDRPSRLRRRGAGLIGLVVPELSNPFFPQLAQVIEELLSRRGYTPVLCSQTAGGSHEDDYVSTLLDHGVAGAVFVSGIHAISDSDPRRYRELLDLGLPVVLVNGYQQGLPCIATDDTAAARAAVRHLVELGHKRIGIATGPVRYTPAQRRVAGFTQAVSDLLRVSAADLAPLVVHSNYTIDGGTLAGMKLIEAGATAVVCGSDLMALGVIRAARQIGLDVPRELSVIGSDDNGLLEFTDPPLSTVRQPVRNLAEATCYELFAQIGGAAPLDGELLLQPELVIRGSTARRPAHRATQAVRPKKDV